MFVGQCRAILSTASFGFLHLKLWRIIEADYAQFLAKNGVGSGWCLKKGCYTDTRLDCKVILSDENQSQFLLKVILSKVSDKQFCSPHFALKQKANKNCPPMYFSLSGTESGHDHVLDPEEISAPYYLF